MSSEIRNLAYLPKHSPEVFVPTFSTLPISPPISLIVSSFMHRMGTLWICTQKDAWVKDCLFISPMPLGSTNTINALSKCHGPPVKISLLSASTPNLNKKIFSPISSICTSQRVFHTWCRAALRPPMLISLFRSTFPKNNPPQFSGPSSSFCF